MSEFRQLATRSLSPAITQTAGEMAPTRLTVRLVPKAAELLANLCRTSGQTASEVIRMALQQYLNPIAAAAERPSILSNNEKTGGEKATGEYSFPSELHDLLPQFRNFGMELRPERRRCFARLLAACEAAREHSQNAHDRALCAEILRIGRLFGLLPR